MSKQGGSHYPHVFLDANALVKLSRSLSHHLVDERGRKSRIRVLMEAGVLRVATAESLLHAAQTVIERDRSVWGNASPDILVEVLGEAIKEEWIILIHDEDADALDESRAKIYEALAEDWYNLLVSRDREDANMLRYAALAYAKFCVVRSRREGSDPYYVPSYMLIVSDDNDVYRVRRQLNRSLWEALRKAAEAGINFGRYPRKNLVSVAKWNEFKEYAKHLTTSLG